MIPQAVAQPAIGDYFEIMTRAVFQAGISWRQIADRWEAYRSAFAAFDVSRVAAYDDLDVARVLDTPGILRSPRKVRATIANARALLDVQRDFGTLDAYVGSFAAYADLAKDFRKRFSFMGEMNVWYVLFLTGNPVPRFEPWVQTIRGDHPRMHEMVVQARDAGRSPEY